jgi:glycosyltransferase involved in cell wall biosynthesis
MSKIKVIIPLRKRKPLQLCIKKFPQRFRVIINNNSTDNTIKVATAGCNRTFRKQKGYGYAC